MGREVDSIIRDLVEMAVKMSRDEAIDRVRTRAEDVAEERILDALLPPARSSGSDSGTVAVAPDNDGAARQRFRKLLREGKLDDKEIEIEVTSPTVGVEIMGPPGMEEMTNQLQSMFQNLGSDKRRSRKLPVGEAMKMLTEEEANNLINDEDLKHEAVQRVEQDCTSRGGGSRLTSATKK